MSKTSCFSDNNDDNDNDNDNDNHNNIENNDNDNANDSDGDSNSNNANANANTNNDNDNDKWIINSMYSSSSTGILRTHTAYRWHDSSVSRVLHQYCRGYGFEFRSGLSFLDALILQLLKLCA